MPVEIDLDDLSSLSQDEIAKLSTDNFAKVVQKLVEIADKDRQEWQIKYYRPASDRCMVGHESRARLLGLFGGNGSSKTETMLVDMVACMTGVFPECLQHLAKQKFRGPIAARLVVESLTTTLSNIIIPKLQWWKWTGLPPIGGDKGHYGWIPRRCLIDGSWEKSWSAQNRTLRVVCLDPENNDRALGESTLQFMAHTQEPSDFASGDFHLVGLDEPPRYAIFRENQARTMRVNGRIVLAMTWPDDPSIPVDWIFDEIYEVGRPGSPKKLDDVDLVELWTNENRNLDQDAIAAQAAKWSEEVRQVRLFGRPIRFSNRIHPNFTDTPSWWCFKCNRPVSVDHGHEEAA